MVSSMCGRIALSGGTQHTGITARASAMWMKCVLGWLLARWMRQRRRALLKCECLLWLGLRLLVSSGHKMKRRCVRSSAPSSLPGHLTQHLRTWRGGCWGLWRVLRTARCIAHWCLGWSWWEVRHCMTKTCARWNQPLWTWGKLFWMRRKLLRAMERSLRQKREFRGFGCNGIGGATASSHSQASTRTWDKRGWELVDWNGYRSQPKSLERSW